MPCLWFRLSCREPEIIGLAVRPNRTWSCNRAESQMNLSSTISRDKRRRVERSPSSPGSSHVETLVRNLRPLDGKSANRRCVAHVRLPFPLSDGTL